MKRSRSSKKISLKKFLIIGVLVILAAAFIYASLRDDKALLSLLRLVPQPENQVATALPFGQKCYNYPFFICGDYAYEYCQYNGVKNCYQLAIWDLHSKLQGHALNIVRSDNLAKGTA